MKTFNTIDEILDFAMNEEQKAIEFYAELASKTQNKDMKLVFDEFAKEEVSHKVKLLGIKEEGLSAYEDKVVTNLHISDYVLKAKPSPDMTYEETLIVAMNKEKLSYKLYMALAKHAPNNELKQLFLRLAQEESKHKLRFEIEYDDNEYHKR